MELFSGLPMDPQEGIKTRSHSRTSQVSRQSRWSFNSSLSPNRRPDHPFGVPDDYNHLNVSRGRTLSSLTTRSSSSNSLSPSARSTSSSESYLSFPRLTAPPTAGSAHHFHHPPRSSSSPLPAIKAPLPDSIVAYDALIDGPVSHYVRYSGSVGQDVMRQANLVKSLFETQREFILLSTGQAISEESTGLSTADSSRCSTAGSAAGSGPVQAAKMRDIKSFASRHSYSPNAAHLYFVADTIGALGWVVAGDRPSTFIRDAYAGGKHHVKNVPGMDEKTTSTIMVAVTEAQRRIHSNWVSSWQNVILQLDSYVRDYHTRGLTWHREK